MSIGNGIPYMGYQGVVALAKEGTYGTFVTGTMWLEFNSESLAFTKEEIKLESINGLRDYTKRLTGNTSVGGSLEAPFNIASDACVWLFRMAMGGAVSSAAASTGSYIHNINAGDLENMGSSATAAGPKSLSISVRPGSSGMQTYNFYGNKVNSFNLKAEAGQPVIMSCDIVGKGCSTSATIPAAVYSDINPVTFAGITFKTGATTTTYDTEYVKSFELTINNNINSDHRVLGSAEVAHLHAGKRDISLKVNQVFDTTTAYERYSAATITAIELTLDSLVSITTGVTTYACVITLPRCYVQPFTPQIKDSGPIMQEIEYRAYYATTQAYAINATIRNATTNYD